MSISPLITFKAGRCDLDTSSKPYKVAPVAEPGYIYLYTEDELVHFCWRGRNVPLDNPELDLMILQDARFEPYNYRAPGQPPNESYINGRMFNLKFSSSSQRYLFWLQSGAQSSEPSHWSPRDLKIGQIVDRLLQGEELDVMLEIMELNASDDRDYPRPDDDETMEDIEGQGGDAHQGGGGGAGANATGGDVREEGHASRDAGADGGRAAGGTSEAERAVQNFLASLRGNQNLEEAGQSAAQGKLFTTLPDLLPTSITVPLIAALPVSQLDNLLSFLPPTLLLLSQESDAQIDGMVEPNPGTAAAALEAMSVEQKRALIVRVLRSPQFHQSLGSLTVAIRDGGLPMISEALGVNLEHGGLLRGGSVPLGGGEAVEAFVDGIKRTVEKEKR